MEKDAVALREMGYQVVAVTQDAPEGLAKTVKKNKLSFTFLSDADMEMSKAYGLAWSVNDEMVEAYKGYGLDLVEMYGRSKPLMSVPAIFVLDTNGVVKFHYANPDYRVRLDSGVLLAAAKAYK